VSERERKPWQNGQLAIDDVDVAVAEAGALDPDEDLTDSGLRDRDVLDHQRALVGVEPCGAHDGSS
jgi:hypothetical protein